MRGLGYPVLIAISLTAAPLFAATAVAAEAGAAAGAPQPHAAAFESDIKAFEVTDRTLRSPTPRIVFIGSSSIRMWDTLAKDFPQHRVVNRGFGGSYIADSTTFADRILPPHKPALIVMYAGANDIDHGNTSRRISTPRIGTRTCAPRSRATRSRCRCACTPMPGTTRRISRTV